VPIFHVSWKHMCEMESHLVPLRSQSVDWRLSFAVCCLGNSKLVPKEILFSYLSFYEKHESRFYVLNISTSICSVTGLKSACFCPLLYMYVRACVRAWIFREGKSGLFLWLSRSLWAISLYMYILTRNIVQSGSTEYFVYIFQDKLQSNSKYHSLNIILNINISVQHSFLKI
jgi:hypothetical protein